MSAQNGGNPRLDRIEKLIEESERANKQAHARSDAAHARHDREIAQIREIGRKTRDDLRRWTSLGVKEAPHHRKRIADLEAKSAKYEAMTNKYEAIIKQNLAEITDKLNGLIGYVDALGK